MEKRKKLNGNSKADKVEYAKRVRDVALKLLRGHAVVDMVVDIQEDYGVGEAQAYAYIKEATARVHQKIEGSLEEKVNQHYYRLVMLYTSCLDNNDRTNARAVLKDIASLVGLDAPKRTDLTTGGEKIQQVLVKFVGDDQSN